MSVPTNSGIHPVQKSIANDRDHPSSARKIRREIDVSTLFEGTREVALLHRGETYSLRITANGKLILTK